MSTDYMDKNAIQCSCGQTFAQLSAFTNHQRTCKKRKKCLSGALVKAKLVWDNRKKRHTSDNPDEYGDYSGTSGVPSPLDTNHISRQHHPQEKEKENSHNKTNQQSVSAHRSISRAV